MAIQFQGFLPDECCLVLGESVRRARVFSYSDVGLQLDRRIPDRTVMAHAREHGAIVITRNGSDFAQEAQRAAKLSTAGECQAMRCQDGIGLVTVSDPLKRFHFERVTKALRLGKHEIGWGDVFMLNLWVSIQVDERVEVRMLARCVRCMTSHVADCERCTELDVAAMYESQEVGGRRIREVSAPPDRECRS